MSQTMTAVQMYAPGDIRTEEVAVPTPGPGEVLMQVAACGVCGSVFDRMYVKGGHTLPLICGHEFSAYVASLGPGVDEVEVGDLVTVPPMLPCRRCAPCTQGHYSLCVDYDYYGSRRDGAYAEFVAGPAAPLVKVPEGLDPRAAAMVDPSAIALHGIWGPGCGPGTGSRCSAVAGRSGCSRCSGHGSWGPRRSWRWTPLRPRPNWPARRGRPPRWLTRGNWPRSPVTGSMWSWRPPESRRWPTRRSARPDDTVMWC